MQARLRGLRVTALPILQCSVAAALAWLVATEVVGHGRPFFAPVSAIVALGLGAGRRWRRAIELVVGVSLGILVADLLVHGIGTGTLQIALVVALAMSAAVLLGGGPLVVGQAATSAVLVATLQPPSAFISGSRAIDALVGGTIGLVVHALLLPANPLATAQRAAGPVISELSAVLEDLAAALRDRDRPAVVRALTRARAIDDLQGELHDAMEVAREVSRMAPAQRRARGPLALYITAEPLLDLAVRNVRVLARAVLRAVELGDHVPPEVVTAVEDLAQAVRCLGAGLMGEVDDEARVAAIRAAGRATLALEQTGNLSVSVIVGQVRATATDLLRGLGMEREDAVRVVRQAASRLAQETSESPPEP